MGQQSLRAAVVAANAAVRLELARATRSAGHRVTLPAAAAQLAACDLAIVAADATRDLMLIRRAAPDLPAIAVLSKVDRRAVSMLLREGVAGIVGLSELDESLPPTILAVTSGQVCIPKAYAAQAAQPQLSTREKQILGMVVLGFANIEIAQRLVVAESTVKSHLHSAFRKLGVSSRVEATALILNPENGLGTGILTIPTAESDSSSRSI